MSFSRSSRWRPDARMSSRYSSCLEFRSPNRRSSSTSENPITHSTVSEARGTCSRGTRTCACSPPRASSLARQLLKQSRVLDRENRLARKRLHQLDRPLRKPPGARRRTTSAGGSGPHAPVVRRASTASPPGRAPPSEGRVKPRRGPRPRRACASRRHGPTSVSRRPIRGAKRRQQFIARAERRPDLEGLRLVVDLGDRTALGARELHGMGDDRREHLVEVEAGAHCLSDVAQPSSSSTDRASSCAFAAPACIRLAFRIAIAP